MEKTPISEYSLQDLLGESLTSTLCVNIEKNTKVWVVTGMLACCLESFTDSVAVRENSKPIGIVGGKDVIERVFKDPTPDFFEKTNVEDIMEKNFTVVTKETKLKELLNYWKQTRRAFAMIPNEFFDYSALSAKKILEIGKKCKTQMAISEIPKKKVVTFKKDDTMREIISSMLDNKTRKLLLDGSSQFINDRIILERISEELKCLRCDENFLDLPASGFKLEKAKVVSENLTIPEVSKIMYEMEHPYVVFQDQVISPWDICMILLSDNLTEYEK